MLTPTGYPPLPNTEADMAHSTHSTQPALRSDRANPRAEDKPPQTRRPHTNGLFTLKFARTGEEAPVSVHAPLPADLAAVVARLWPEIQGTDPRDWPQMRLAELGAPSNPDLDQGGVSE